MHFPNSYRLHSTLDTSEVKKHIRILHIKLDAINILGAKLCIYVGPQHFATAEVEKWAF